MTVSHEISLDGLSVCIGMPSSRGISPLVIKSMFATKDLCQNLGVPCQLAMVVGNAVIQWARDDVLDLLLESDANRFFLIDSDIVWNAEDFMRLLALSQKRSVVCASYPAKKDNPTFYIRHNAPIVADEYGLVEVLGVGLGFTVLRRDVVEAVSDKAPTTHDEISGKDIPNVFMIGNHNGNRKGEDMSFFEKVAGLGHKIYLDPSIELGHIGTKVYRGSVINALGMAT